MTKVTARSNLQDAGRFLLSATTPAGFRVLALVARSGIWGQPVIWQCRGSTGVRYKGCQVDGPEDRQFLMNHSDIRLFWFWIYHVDCNLLSRLWIYHVDCYLLSRLSIISR